MDHVVSEIIKQINPAQTLIILGVIIYYVEGKINGLGQRFDKQFGDYKEKHKEEIDSLKERIFKVEVQLQLNREHSAKQSENPQCS